MPDQITVVATAVNTALTVAAVVLAFRFALFPALLEVFRQRLFRLRRSLFLHRVDGHVSADDEAYLILMRRMNGSIRFAESITFGRLFVFWAFSMPKNESDGLADAMRASPARELLEPFAENLGFELVRHLAISSPLAWAFVLLLVPISISIGFKSQLARLAHRLGRRPAVERLQFNASALFDADLSLSVTAG